MKSDTPVRVSIRATPPPTRRDVVHLTMPSGAAAIATGDLTKGIAVPAGYTIREVELDNGGTFTLDGDGIETVTIEMLAGATASR